MAVRPSPPLDHVLLSHLAGHQKGCHDTARGPELGPKVMFWGPGHPLFWAMSWGFRMFSTWDVLAVILLRDKRQGRRQTGRPILAMLVFGRKVRSLDMEVAAEAWVKRIHPSIKFDKFAYLNHFESKKSQFWHSINSRQILGSKAHQNDTAMTTMPRASKSIQEHPRASKSIQEHPRAMMMPWLTWGSGLGHPSARGRQTSHEVDAGAEGDGVHPNWIRVASGLHCVN
jgi:hypothetical protein